MTSQIHDVTVTGLPQHTGVVFAVFSQTLTSRRLLFTTPTPLFLTNNINKWIHRSASQMERYADYIQILLYADPESTVYIKKTLSHLISNYTYDLSRWITTTNVKNISP